MMVVLAVACATFAEPTTQPSLPQLKADAPDDVKLAFELALKHRANQIMGITMEMEESTSLLSAYEKSIVAPSLKPSESPKFTNKGVWAFRSKGDKDGAIGELATKIKAMEAKIASYLSPSYLPNFNSIPLPAVVAESKSPEYWEDMDRIEIAEDIGRHPERVTHNMNELWAGKILAIRVCEIGGENVVVDVIANVKAWGEMRVDVAPGITEPKAYSYFLPAKIARATVKGDVIGNCAVGSEIDVKDTNFVMRVVKGRFYLSTPDLSKWIEIAQATTQPSN